MAAVFSRHRVGDAAAGRVVRVDRRRALRVDVPERPRFVYDSRSDFRLVHGHQIPTASSSGSSAWCRCFYYLYLWATLAFYDVIYVLDERGNTYKKEDVGRTARADTHSNPAQGKEGSRERGGKTSPRADLGRAQGEENLRCSKLLTSRSAAKQTEPDHAAEFVADGIECGIGGWLYARGFTYEGAALVYMLGGIFSPGRIIRHGSRGT